MLFRSPYAAGTISHLYISGIMAVVLRSGVAGNEAGRKLARNREVLPQIRRGDHCRAGSGDCVVRLGTLAEPGEDGIGVISSRPADNLGSIRYA